MRGAGHVVDEEGIVGCYLEKGTIGTILKANGHATSWFGKDHNTPSFQSSQAGPFDQWPNGMGFDYFYGFVGGDASQWQPNLFRNTTAIYPFLNNPGWNLETAMADEAIQYIKQYDAAKSAWCAKTLVIRHDEQHIGRALRWHHTRRPPGGRLGGPILNHSAELRVGRWKLLAWYGRGGVGRT
jgi:arylsulfatase A-like enzyme